MRKKRSDSQKLRQLAEEFLVVAFEGQEASAELEDLATSVVRQWATYGGNATLFVGEDLIYLSVKKTPLGNFTIIPHPGDPGWVESLEVDWKISPDQIPGLLTQLNLRQSAEVVNGEGIPLRVWTNPKDRQEEVEPLGNRPQPSPQPVEKEQYCWLAARHLSKHLLMLVDEKEMEILVNSVVNQWQEYQGHACIFLDQGRQLALTLTNKPGKPVACSIHQVSLEKCLADVGFRPEAIPDLIVAINRGMKIRTHDKNGVPALVWHDPKDRAMKTCADQLQK